jgi:hypothetical protein
MIQAVSNPTKIPTAQAMAVMAFSGSFAKGLRKSSKTFPAPMNNDWPFPYERIVAEAAAFYYFYMIKDYLTKPNDDSDWDDIDEDPADSDPYFDSLRMSMHICDALIHSLSDGNFSDRFVANRALAFASIQRSPSNDVVESLSEFIMEAWNPDYDGRPVLDLSAPIIPLQIAIVSMPINAIRDTCRELYEANLA